MWFCSLEACRTWQGAVQVVEEMAATVAYNLQFGYWARRQLGEISLTASQKQQNFNQPMFSG
jgi:uncharacterized membrane protein